MEVKVRCYHNVRVHSTRAKNVLRKEVATLFARSKSPRDDDECVRDVYDARSTPSRCGDGIGGPIAVRPIHAPAIGIIGLDVRRGQKALTHLIDFADVEWLRLAVSYFV